MKKSIFRILSLALTAALMLGCFPAGVTASAVGIQALAVEHEVSAAQTSDTVTIGNDLIKRTFSIADDHLTTAAIENLRSDTTLTPGEGSEDFIIYVTNEYSYYADPDFDGKLNGVDWVNPVANRAVPGWEDAQGTPITWGTPAVVPVTAIKASQLTLDDVTIKAVTKDGSAGKHIAFTFMPYTAAGAEWTVTYNVVMYDGDHYMRSFLEIGVPEEDEDNAYINCIDTDAFNVSALPNDKLFSCRLDIENQFISQFQQRMGQPLYVDSLFFGIEFQATNNRITPDPNVAANDDTARSLLMRYYSGKNFVQITKDSQGKFVTWPALVGAGRSYEYLVMQDDFYEYVNENAQGTYFRTQFNTWYEGQMNITPQSITASYMGIEQGLTQAGLPPINAYIIDDGYNDYSGPFWGFKPAFANNVLKDISQMMTDAGGAFAKWISPRGGYGQSQAPFMEAAGTGYRSTLTTGTSLEICAASPLYIQNLYEDMCFNMDEYNVNYWKLDGMARNICINPTHGHMTGGVIPGSAIKDTTIGGGTQGADADDVAASSMWTFTELWENYNQLFLSLREHQEANGKGLWLNSTGTSVPSPFYLLTVNSIKVITSADSGKAGDPSAPDGARRLTYRDAGYYEFFNNNKFQFPYNYIWNHDPIYALSNDYVVMSEQDLRENLYGNAMRGAAVWELLFSPSVFTEGQWLATNEALTFSKDNQDILRHTRQIAPTTADEGPIRDNVTNDNVQPYIYSAWGTRSATGTYEGYVSFRNPKVGSPVTMSLTLDKLAGVREGTSNLHMTYVLPSEIDPGQVQGRKETYDYGDTVTVELDPLDFVILHFGPGDETPPQPTRTEVIDANTLRISFNEAIALTGGLPAVAGHTVTDATLTDDYRNVDITVSDAFADNEAITLASITAEDLSGNGVTVTNKSARYAVGRSVSQFNAAADLTGAASVSDDALLQSAVLSLNGDTTGFASGFSADLTNKLSVASLIKTTDADATILEQSGTYSVGLTADGKVQFTVGDLTVTSKQAVNDGEWHHFACVKEPNEMIKVYIDGKISASSYNGYNLNILQAGTVTIGSSVFTGQLSQLKVYNKSLGYLEVAALAAQPLSTYDLAGYNAFTIAGMKPSLPDTVQARYDTTGYFRNYDATWSDVSAGSYSSSGKVAINATLPGFGGLAVGGKLSVLEAWPSGVSLKGESLNGVLTEMKADGWEILNQNDANLAVGENGLTITANYGKMDRGNVDPTYPDGIDVNTAIPGVVNENFFLMDPGLDDYCVTVGLSTAGASPYDRLNESAGLIIRQDDDNYVRMTYRASGCTGNGAIPAMSLHVKDDGRELTLEESTGSGSRGRDPWAASHIALVKEGEYYTGYYSTDDGDTWIKVGTVKATLESPKTGFHATLGARDVPGFSNNGFKPTFFDFGIHQYSVGLDIAGDTESTLDVPLGAASPKYAWADTTFSDGSRGALLVELPAIDTSAVGQSTVKGTVAGEATEVDVTINVKAVVTPPTDNGGGSTPDGSSITIPGGGKLSTPAGKPPVQSSNGDVTIPGGGTITLPSGSVITVPSGTVVSKDGKVTFPQGSGCSITLGNGHSFGIGEGVTIILDAGKPLGYYVDMGDLFKDIIKSNWFHDDVIFAYAHGLMVGTSGSPMLFSPDESTTRGMIVTILYRMAGNPTASGSDPFSDVADGTWYTDAVKWAAANGIVSGVGGGRFDPDVPITRQDFSVILVRYANFMGGKLPATRSYAGFMDEAKIADYAKAAVEELCKAGIINGKDHNAFDPAGTATRAEGAAMLHRFLEAATK